MKKVNLVQQNSQHSRQFMMLNMIMVRKERKKGKASPNSFNVPQDLWLARFFFPHLHHSFYPLNVYHNHNDNQKVSFNERMRLKLITFAKVKTFFSIFKIFFSNLFMHLWLNKQHGKMQRQRLSNEVKQVNKMHKQVKIQRWCSWLDIIDKWRNHLSLIGKESQVRWGTKWRTSFFYYQLFFFSSFLSV